MDGKEGRGVVLCLGLVADLVGCVPCLGPVPVPVSCGLWSCGPVA